MKRALLLLLIATLGANCARRTDTGQANTNALQNATPNAQPTTENANLPTADSDEPAATQPEAEVPAEFKEVNFKNFTYPASFEYGNIKLKDGVYEYPSPEGGGGDDFELRGVNFVDLNGDGKKEALIQIFWLSCGGSCDGGVHLFYVYSIRRNKPELFWRFESGSGAYGCGLKSFILDQRIITLEVFRRCNFAGHSVKTENRRDWDKFDVKFFTRFILKFDGRTFVLKGKEVLPYSGDVRNGMSEIKISDD